MDTPLQEALAFLNTLSKTNMILDPKVLANKEARDHSTSNGHVAGPGPFVGPRNRPLEYQIRGDAIYVFDPKLERRREAEARLAENPKAGQGQMQGIPKLSVKRRGWHGNRSQRAVAGYAWHRPE